MGRPAAPKTCGWLGQVGVDSHTAAPGSMAATRSPATRRAPVPPGVCMVSTRPLADGGVVGAEDEVAHGPGVGGVAADGLVDLGGLAGEDACLGFTDGVEHGRGAGLIDIDTRGERHLVGSVVCAEALHQPQDGVGCTGLEISEHGHA